MPLQRRPILIITFCLVLTSTFAVPPAQSCEAGTERGVWLLPNPVVTEYDVPKQIAGIVACSALADSEGKIEFDLNFIDADNSIGEIDEGDGDILRRFRDGGRGKFRSAILDWDCCRRDDRICHRHSTVDHRAFHALSAVRPTVLSAGIPVLVFLAFCKNRAPLVLSPLRIRRKRVGSACRAEPELHWKRRSVTSKCSRAGLYAVVMNVVQ